MINSIIKGNALTILKTFPDNYIDLIVTSPPYYGLRDYSTAPILWGGDPECNHIFITHTRKQTGGTAKATVGNQIDDRIHFTYESHLCSLCGGWIGELGQEPTFQLYIEHLKEIFIECRRVLKKEGSLWVNMGDSYGGSGNGTNDVTNNKNDKQLYLKHNKANIKSNIKGYNKSLLSIPHRLAISLVDSGFILRNTIIWHKKNCLPESVKDRFTKSYEFFFFFTKSNKYYFKQQFEPYKASSIKRVRGKNFHNQTGGEKDYRNTIDKHHSRSIRTTLENFAKSVDSSEGKNKRDVWTTTLKGYKEAHFATFPEVLIQTPIDACCPKEICNKCGKAREYIYGSAVKFPEGETNSIYPKDSAAYKYNKKRQGYRELGYESPPIVSKGLTDCGCGEGFHSGIVLDPFMGSGTVAKVALEQGKSYVGIELNPEYIKLAEKRIEKVQLKLI